MNVKISVLIILFVSFQSTLAQGSLYCEYALQSGVYSCKLLIDNPNGFDNFTGISGRHVIPNSFRDVTEISASTGSNSINIPSIICEKFVNVKEVTLSYVGIGIIGENSFKGCTKILKISLNGNEIAEVNQLAFSENLHLESLTLESNWLTTLPEELFINQLKLDSLFVSNNQISDMPNKIFDPLESLTYIDLSRNKIVNPKVEWFAKLVNLDKLLLNDNRIVELPENIFSSLQFLYYLTLANNDIRTIDSKSFGTLPMLELVDLKHNRIDAIDEQFISNNTNVYHLNAEDNICVSKTIEDVSPQRETMRNELRDCFKNFESLKRKHDIWKYVKIFILIIKSILN
jgi:Leucine-rich repeat (LRR) protein